MPIVRALKRWTVHLRITQGFNPMMKRVASLALLAGAVVMSYAASAAPNWDGPGQARPMFGVIKNTGPLNYEKGKTPPPGATLTQWSGGSTDLLGHNITFKMAGAD